MTFTDVQSPSNVHHWPSVTIDSEVLYNLEVLYQLIFTLSLYDYKDIVMVCTWFVCQYLTYNIVIKCKKKDGFNKQVQYCSLQDKSGTQVDLSIFLVEVSWLVLWSVWWCHWFWSVIGFSFKGCWHILEHSRNNWSHHHNGGKHELWGFIHLWT